MVAKLHRKRVAIGAIVIPDAFQRAQESCTIVAVGPRAPSELRAGQTALIGKFNGVEIPAPEHDPDGEYVVLEADHVQRAPFCPDLYAIVEHEADEDITLVVSSDRPKRKTG